jgi:hypothetical protein
MIVSENTQTLEFKIGYKADSVDVSIVNETTKEEVLNEPQEVQRMVLL